MNIKIYIGEELVNEVETGNNVILLYGNMRDFCYRITGSANELQRLMAWGFSEWQMRPTKEETEISCYLNGLISDEDKSEDCSIVKDIPMNREDCDVKIDVQHNCYQGSLTGFHNYLLFFIDKDGEFKCGANGWGSQKLFLAFEGIGLIFDEDTKMLCKEIVDGTLGPFFDVLRKKRAENPEGGKIDVEIEDLIKTKKPN